MDASRRGELLYKLADLMERDAVNYLLFHPFFFFDIGKWMWYFVIKTSNILKMTTCLVKNDYVNVNVY